MKVLIVDDDPLVSGALKVILESEEDMEQISGVYGVVPHLCS